jgi:hypothetical protein
MAAIDYGAAIAPFTKVLKTLTLFDGTGSPITQSLVDFDGTISFVDTPRTSVSYKPNGRRPSGGALVLSTDDIEMDATLSFGAKSWAGSTVQTPLEFMKGETVNAIALTSTATAGKFLFGMDLTFVSESGGSQIVKYTHCEYLGGTSVEREGILFVDVSIRIHQNGFTSVT